MSETARRRLIALLAAFCASAGAQAAMYKWTDENGQTVYSQTPPPSRDAVRIKKDAAPDSAEAARTREDLRQEMERSYDKAVEQEQAEGEQAEKQREQDARAKNCAAARKNLVTIKNLGTRRVRTPDGEYKILPEDEREVQIQQAREQIKEFCD